MKTILLLFSIGLFAGCSINSNEPAFYIKEQIHVPYAYCISSKNEIDGIIPDEERFKSMYNSARWLLVQKYADNINYKISPSFLADHCYGGWPSALDGFEAGMNETNDLIKANIRFYGKEKTHKCLLELLKTKDR